MHARIIAAILASLSVGLSALASACAGDASDDTTPEVDASPDSSRRRESGTTLDPEPEPEPEPEEPEDSGTDAPKDAPPPLPPRKRVFVTKTRYDGNLMMAGGGVDGLDGADKLCALAAQSANLGGTWKAWLSTAAVDAISRIDDVGPWYLVDRTTRAFKDKAALATTPENAIKLNEFGTTTVSGTGPQRVWTGTSVGGTKSASICADWAATEKTGTVGVFTEKTANWTRYAIDPSQPCTSKAPIYCFEQ